MPGWYPDAVRWSCGRRTDMCGYVQTPFTGEEIKRTVTISCPDCVVHYCSEFCRVTHWLAGHHEHCRWVQGHEPRFVRRLGLMSRAMKAGNHKAAEKYYESALGCGFGYLAPRGPDGDEGGPPWFAYPVILADQWEDWDWEGDRAGEQGAHPPAASGGCCDFPWTSYCINTYEPHPLQQQCGDAAPCCDSPHAPRPGGADEPQRPPRPQCSPPPPCSWSPRAARCADTDEPHRPQQRSPPSPCSEFNWAAYRAHSDGPRWPPQQDVHPAATARRRNTLQHRRPAAPPQQQRRRRTHPALPRAPQVRPREPSPAGAAQLPAAAAAAAGPSARGERLQAAKRPRGAEGDAACRPLAAWRRIRHRRWSSSSSSSSSESLGPPRTPPRRRTAARSSMDVF